jgi:hypothetical protein
MRDEGRRSQDTAEVLPHPFVESLRGSIACRAALAESEPQRLGTAPAEVIIGARGQRTTTAREPALATADQAAPYILIGCMVSAGHLHVTIQAGRGRPL